MAIETVLVYVVPMFAVWATYIAARKRHETRSIAKLSEAKESGLIEPASLHPDIDPAKCIGCGSCIRACPEGDILGLINGKAELIEPSHCIGHGACKVVCPADAITLVFGTATRGIDIPNVDENFQTNIPGVFIAGELGGMGLVRNAIEQGRQAIDAVRKLEGIGAANMLDVLIVGAGPAGFSASLAAMQHRLRFVTVEHGNWDTHAKNFESLQSNLLPSFDRAFATLLRDLSDRGLLESTLVLALGEFARTPRINKDAGRDHWPNAMTIPMAGGGVKGGRIFGSSDARAELPASDPVGPEDLAATIYHLMGVDATRTHEDPLGRPLSNRPE